MNDFRKFSRSLTSRRPPWPVLSTPAERDLFFEKKDVLAPVAAYLADISALPKPLISDFLTTPDIAALAVLCRSLGLSRSALETFALSSATTMDGVSLAPATTLFDALSRSRAKRIVDQWRVNQPSVGEAPCFTLLSPCHDA